MSQRELADIFADPKRYLEGLARWTEDVVIRTYLEDSDWEILFRDASPMHRGFDFVAKHLPSQRVRVVEMKMSKKVGRLRTYLRRTKRKGRQMSLRWVRATASELRPSHPRAYLEIVQALEEGSLERRLVVANHDRQPHGWLPASFGQMGMKGFFESDFRRTPGFD